MLVTHTFYSIDLFVTFLWDDGVVVFQYRLLSWNLSCCRPTEVSGGRTDAKRSQGTEETTTTPHYKIHIWI